MTIERLDFDNENELHQWVERNIKLFFGNVIYIKGFQISTKRNKAGTPDGFILDIDNSSWTIIESELIKHGVWDHIAEQIMRFIVASHTAPTKKKIRDRFFDEIEKKNLIDKLAKNLQIKPERLIHTIENIIEGNNPEIAIFIDESNEDLRDMVESLNTPIKIFRVQKYRANTSIEYLTPDKGKTDFETTAEDVAVYQAKPSVAIEAMGGGELKEKIGRIDIFKLENGDFVTIKYSKPYEQGGSYRYWYRITPKTFEIEKKNNVTHICFILGDEGVIKIPIEIIEDYLRRANSTKKPDDHIDHYHVFILGGPVPKLFINQKEKQWNLEKYFFSF